MQLFVLARHGQSELNVTHRVNGDPAVSVKLTAQGETESDPPWSRAHRDRTRSLHSHALRSHAPDGRACAGGTERSARGRAAPGRHLRRRPRRADDRRLPGVEANAHACRRLSGRREPRRRRTTLRPRVRAPTCTPRAADSRRLPRDPRPVRGQCCVGLGRARRPRARHRELRPLPLRRGRARARRGGDPPQRAATRFLDRCRLCRSVHGLRLPDAVEPALHVGVHHR